MDLQGPLYLTVTSHIPGSLFQCKALIFNALTFQLEQCQQYTVLFSLNKEMQFLAVTMWGGVPDI
jgi:hypothetical protein